MTGGLDDRERDELLAASQVGILGVAASGDAAPPLLAPVWYVHDSGEILVITGRASRKARLLDSSRVATFMVHDSVLPRHVVAAADVSLEAPDPVVRRRIAERYVPAELLGGYLEATADADMVLVRLRPRRWRTVDLTKPPS